MPVKDISLALGNHTIDPGAVKQPCWIGVHKSHDKPTIGYVTETNIQHDERKILWTIMYGPLILLIKCQLKPLIH